MKEHTTIRLESNQKFTFSIKDDWLIVRSHEELERLRIEEKKAKKARFFETYGRTEITGQFLQPNIEASLEHPLLSDDNPNLNSDA